MKRSALVLALAGALVLAAPAAAKELTQAQLCGPAACETVTDRDTLRALPMGGENVGTPPPASRFYVMRLTVREGDSGPTHTWQVYYVPSADMLAVRDEYGTIDWLPIYGDAIPLMKRLTRGLEPFPRPQLSRVTIGGEQVSGDASTYLRLFTVQSAGTARYGEGDYALVDLVSRSPSPWTDGSSEFAFSPSTKTLERGADLIRLPDGLADDVAAARALDPGGDRTLLPWLLLAALVAGIVLLAAAARLLRARRATEIPAPRPAGAV